MIAIAYKHKVLFFEKETLLLNFSAQETELKKEIATLKNSKINIDAQLLKFSNEYDLKKLETEILNIINTGATNKEIAKKLMISIDTVKHYCSNIYEKTGAKNRTKLITLFNGSNFSKLDIKEKPTPKNEYKDV